MATLRLSQLFSRTGTIPQAIDDAFETALLGYSRARSLNYTAQFMVLNTLATLLPGFNEGKQHLSSEAFGRLRSELLKLLKKDAHNIRKGVYPVSVLSPERPIEHVLRIPKLVWDGISVYRRRLSGRTTEFGRRQKEFLDELPRYYRRNFHFQTDGYLSARSAELYEHQVEMLFGGAADAMRRLIIPELRRKFKTSDGKGLRFLEIAAGTGRATRFVHQAFPKAKIIATDLSGPYLKEAQKKLERFDRIDFVQADGTKLPFQDGFFDAVYSIFLYHELPLTAREEVIRESRRVLKPGGVFGLVDSMQTGDIQELDPVLEGFPKQFHEPYYRDYIAHPMEKLIEKAGFTDVRSGVGFLSKVCSGF
jgi:ubiquinone/menaquinone biosynthesis C-methylase UbiE